MRSIFLPLATSFLVAWSCWGVGGKLVSRRIAGVRSATAGHVLSFAVGNIVVSYLLTILGVARLFNHSVFLALSGAGMLIALTHTVKRRSVFFPKPHLHDAGLLILTPFLIPAFLLALAPPFMRDTLVYHLALPKAYLAAHGLTDIPGNFYSAFPKGQEMLWTLLLDIGGEQAPQIFSLLQHVATCLGIYVLVKSRYGAGAATLSVLGYGSTPVAAYFSGCAYVEPAMALMLVTALLTLAERKQLTTGALTVLLGATSGFLLALKYTGLLYAGLIALVFFAAQGRKDLRVPLRQTPLFALAALPGCFWLIRNLIQIGNPVFPFAYELFSGAGWDAERALSYRIYLHDYGMGRAPLDYLLLPLRLACCGRFDSMEFDGVIGPFALFFLFLAIAGAWYDRRRGQEPWLPLIGLATLVSYAFFVFGTQQVRFYLPTQILACIVAAPALSVVLRHLKGKRGLRAAATLLLASVLVFNGYHWFAELGKLGVVKPALGLEKREDFLNRRVPGYPAIAYFNRTASPQDKILCVFTGNYNYYFKYPMISDSFVEDYTLRRLLDEAGETPAAPFRQAGITHLMVNAAILAKSESLSQTQKVKFAKILKKFGTIEFEHRNYFIFKFASN